MPGEGHIFYPNDPPGNADWYGFTDQHIQWGLRDQFNNPLDMESVNEVWTDIASQVTGYANTDVNLANGLAWTSTTNGNFNALDEFNYSGLGRPAGGADLMHLTRPQQGIGFNATHAFFGGSATTGERAVLTTFATHWTNRGVTGQ